MIKHLALIMDGNRRWAKKQNLMPWIGHQHGTKSVQQVIEFCLEQQIPLVSLYTLSLENFKNRAPDEINFLLNIILEQSKSQLPELIKNGVRIKFCGDRSQFPASVKDSVEKLEDATQNLNKGRAPQLTVNILFCYGGRQEIIHATKSIAQDVKSGILDINNISEEIFNNYLWVKSDPDLIIRTGKEKRLSNFLIYQAAYSEIYFTDILWPDLTKQDLMVALEDYKNRTRNFGQ